MENEYFTIFECDTPDGSVEDRTILRGRTASSAWQFFCDLNKESPPHLIDIRKIG